mmetsp:Transcript_31427/g.73726  ORF Transcript_31427/g.73726 Transcript_31427/m.73726 type:complete len:229 (-) Transcript_31427:221-907(-)
MMRLPQTTFLRSKPSLRSSPSSPRTTFTFQVSRTAECTCRRSLVTSTVTAQSTSRASLWATAASMRKSRARATCPISGDMASSLRPCSTKSARSARPLLRPMPARRSRTRLRNRPRVSTSTPHTVTVTTPPLPRPARSSTTTCAGPPRKATPLALRPSARLTALWSLQTPNCTLRLPTAWCRASTPTVLPSGSTATTSSVLSTSRRLPSVGPSAPTCSTTPPPLAITP